MDLKNIVVLIVDDYEPMRDALLYHLNGLIEGVVIETASDGEEAIDILKTSFQKFDLIISDLSMPRMNGLELFRKVKENPDLRKIPFIMLTGSVDMDVERAIKAGGGRLLMKGSNYDLLEEIKEAMGIEN